MAWRACNAVGVRYSGTPLSTARPPQSVWAGQPSRDIGVRLTSHSRFLKTHAIDPQVNEARDFVLEDELVEGPLERWALVRGVGAATPAAPRQNLTGDRYVTDGPRLGLFVSSPEHAAGKHVIKYEFIPDAAKPRTGGKCMLFVDEKPVAQGHIPKSVPFIFSGDEGAVVGLDAETVVSDDYKQGDRLSVHCALGAYRPFPLAHGFFLEQTLASPAVGPSYVNALLRQVHLLE